MAKRSLQRKKRQKKIIINGIYDIETPTHYFTRIYLKQGGVPERDGVAASGREEVLATMRPLPKALGRSRHCRRYLIEAVAVQIHDVRPGCWTCNLNHALANRHKLVVEPGSTTSKL